MPEEEPLTFSDKLTGDIRVTVFTKERNFCMNKNSKRLRYIAETAVVAAVYIVLFVAFAPISSLPIQFRLSEALVLLPALMPSAIPGLFIGCMLANAIASMGWMDIVFGSVATLLAAILTRHIAIQLNISEAADKTYTRKSLYKNGRIYLLPLPSIIINGLIVGSYLPLLVPNSDSKLPITLAYMLEIALSETVVTYIFALALYVALQPLMAQRLKNFNAKIDTAA